MIRIAITDDKKDLRRTLQEKLNEAGKYEVVFTAENGRDFLEKMREARKSAFPDVVLMDIDMPVMGGVEAVLQGKMRYPQTRFLMLTIFDEDEKIFNAIKAGASGYLLKDEPVAYIKKAITELMNNEGAPMSPSIARRALHLLMNATIDFKNTVPQPGGDNFQLSGREKEVLTFLMEGLEYKEIGQQMNVSPNTVRNHIANIYKKLHVTSKTQAIRVFSREQ
ncbi:response regulator transcription factor [Niabella drilacis]|uniref:DNA-binding response regulator, NarL/FixJ family, contains REC and HTH domains n=1 Tax=Niabella drilacis (strain DSM 25811 / CCM 8410 / CCUG 62505 / LMG 26954 / E90) TaxID=1285928 RepID=A0A1G6N0J5_NIADE|nr:response regulator transcription factor [Niabella drilacis]SDC61340.1 DNA-binding response regulator, NarL/FixJ family, contains REC and HTH domains [Niabella drilacis]